jgi:TolB-like protein
LGQLLRDGRYGPVKNEAVSELIAASPGADDEPARVLGQLERILSSHGFDASARNRAFLSYVVNETLAGRADHIKGYTVAQEVFQRDADFDPQLDPVVRIEAGRLRRSLERYYLTAGRADPLEIALPKGSYVPRFEPRQAVELALAWGNGRQPAGSRVRPFVMVRPFASLAPVPAEDDIALGLAEELIGRLASYEGLSVIAEGAAPEAPASPGFVLQGSTRRSGARLRVSVQLLGLADRRYLWVRTFDWALRPKHVWALQEEIAAGIAEALAGPSGPIDASVR